MTDSFRIRTVQEMIADNLIVRVLAGSHAYGMALPTSDIDHRGIFCADKVNVMTPFFPVEQSIDMSGDNDITIYELSKYLRLYVDANPNILEILWVDDGDVLDTSPEYEILKQYRQQLLSTKAAFTFTGYSFAQIKRIKGHNKWINNPQLVDPPKQTDFVSLVYNFTDEKIFKINIRDYRDGYRLIPFDGNLYGMYKSDGYQTFADDFSLNTVYDADDPQLFLNADDTRRLPLFIVKFNKEHYLQSKEEWANYWTWKKNRNVARSTLEEQFSFDTKHGAHCVRLLRMGAELLQTGELKVKRPDAAELLAIRHGAWTYEQMIEYAEYMDNEIRNVWYKQSPLPKTPNIKLAAKVLMEVQESIYTRSTVAKIK
jgi:predicted nucleotidyltransferase